MPLVLILGNQTSLTMITRLELNNNILVLTTKLFKDSYYINQISNSHKLSSIQILYPTLTTLLYTPMSDYNPRPPTFLKMGLTCANERDRDAQNVEFTVKCIPPKSRVLHGVTINIVFCTPYD